MTRFSFLRDLFFLQDRTRRVIEDLCIDEDFLTMGDETTIVQPTDGQTPDAPETTPGNESGQAGETATLTQSQVDAMLKKRLARAEETVMKKLLEDLGVDSLDTAKATLKAKREAEEAEKSELQKAQEQLKAEQNRIKALEEAQEAREVEIRAERLDNAIRNEAKSEGAHDPDEVLVLLKTQGTDGLMDDDGKPKSAKIKKLVADHRESKAHLYKPKRTSPGSPSNADGQSGSPKIKKALAAQRQFKSVMNRGV